MTARRQSGSPRRPALLLLAALVVVYNANGRELGTVDSQPAKFTAREMAVSGTMVLDRVIAERPLLAERPAFAVDRTGHTRSAYPLLPALIASLPATVLHRSGLVDMDAPLAPNLVAKLTASLLTAAAVSLVFLALARVTSRAVALAVAAGLGLGTGFWPQVSQTLWAHETVAFGLAVALWAWLRPRDAIGAGHVLLGAAGLVMAGSARPQMTPLVVVMLAWMASRTGRRAWPAVALVAAAGAVQMAVNLHWFGHVLGATPRLEAMHPEIHAVPGSVGNPLTGAAGLLLSPSRGLLVFSPIVLVAAAGLAAAWRRDDDRGLRWLLGGLVLQFAVYASYSVWWGGYTYGPRYLLDLLVPLAPVAALGLSRFAARPAGRIAASLLLIWSIGVSGAGAFVYPNEFWNTRPVSVDHYHARLWEIGDSQIPRAFGSAPSPQNFGLFTAEAVRQAPE